MFGTPNQSQNSEDIFVQVCFNICLLGPCIFIWRCVLCLVVPWLLGQNKQCYVINEHKIISQNVLGKLNMVPGQILLCISIPTKLFKKSAPVAQSMADTWEFEHNLHANCAPYVERSGMSLYVTFTVCDKLGVPAPFLGITESTQRNSEDILDQLCFTMQQGTFRSLG